MTDELKRFTHEKIADARLTCLKLLVILEKSLKGKKTDYDGEMEEIYVYSIVNELPEALDEIERLRSQLAARDALIERLIEVGEFFSGGFEHDAFGVLANGNWFEGYDEGTVRGREFLEEIQSRLHAIVAEYRSMSGGVDFSKVPEVILPDELKLYNQEGE